MFGFLKQLFGGAASTELEGPPAWSFRDSESIGDAYGKPSSVHYELDVSKWRYRVEATFHNDDPYAESSVSLARMEYEVRRSPEGQWDMRLIGRNLRHFDTPEAWQAAPARFVDAWEQAWAKLQAGATAGQS